MKATRTAAIGMAILGAVLCTAHADVVVVVAPDSPLMSLTRSQLADIYLGRINRLPDGTSVVPIDQTDVSAAHTEFYEKYLGRTPAQIKAHWSKLIFTGRGQPPRTLADGDTLAAFIATNPHTIGYLDPAVVNRPLKVLPIE